MTIGAVTFDCYGTLIDWDSGLLQTIRTTCPESRHIEDDAILQAFDIAERQALSQPYRPYREVLSDAGRDLALKFDFNAIDLEVALPNSVCEWPAFGDTVTALTGIRRDFPNLQIGVLSNIDTAILADTIQQQFEEFLPDFAVTAEDVSSYKPAFDHFERMLSLTNCSSSNVLHVAQSVRHDIEPGNALGMRTCWVKRRRLRQELPVKNEADFEISALTELSSLLREIDL